jgi:hypothetical protein
MIQPVGASPIQKGIQSMQKVSFINDPNLLISLHTYAIRSRLAARGVRESSAARRLRSVILRVFP